MKEETKNEMDLLLRRLGRRDDASLSNATDSHLDADELNAYAENALPVAARARYMAHLAECSRCRELVVQLSSAVGVVATTESANISKPSTWRTFLASLFTPMVLRYAAPALGLIVIAGIGFVILRREQSATSISQVNHLEERPTALPAQPEATTNGLVDRASGGSSPQVERQAKNEQPAQAAPPPPNAPPTVSSVQADVSKDKAAEEPKPEQQTAAANEPPAAKAEPTATPEESKKPADTDVSKKEVRGLAGATPTAGRTLQAAEKDREGTQNFERAPQTADKLSVGSAGSVDNLRRDNLSANTRSVAGRRFQKKGGVWIDTAYDSSQEVVSLSRGSEQYRALVADEPSIKTIADELNGEIIVVWKGHTYRIR